MKNALSEFLKNGGSLDEVKALAISVKPHPRYPNLLHFKYDQIDSPTDNPLVQASRGVILDSADNWKPVCWGFNRFFNLGQKEAAAMDWASADFYEKVDGTLIQVYWYDNQWHCATTGTPDAGGQVNGDRRTFAELFWEVFQKEGLSLREFEERMAIYRQDFATLMFELVGPLNQVVVRYEHGIRWLGMRTYLQEFQPHYVSTSTYEGLGNPKLVQKFNFKDLAAATAYFQEKKGHEFEGFVAVDKHFNRVKIKHPDYVLLHHARDGFSPKTFVELIQKGEGSEVLAYWPEVQVDYEKLVGKYDALCQMLDAKYTELKDIPVQKDFALQVMASGLPMKNILFEMRKFKTTARQQLASSRTDHVAEVLQSL